MSKAKHPSYYNQHPSGVECIQIIKWYNFPIGSAMKYLWRNGLKTEEGMQDKEKQIEDLEKAIECIQFEIEKLKQQPEPTEQSEEFVLPERWAIYGGLELGNFLKDDSYSGLKGLDEDAVYYFNGNQWELETKTTRTIITLSQFKQSKLYKELYG